MPPLQHVFSVTKKYLTIHLIACMLACRITDELEDHNYILFSDVHSKTSGGRFTIFLNVHDVFRDVHSLDVSKVSENNQLAFEIAEKEFGIPPIMSGPEMAAIETPDKLTMVSYLYKFYEYFRKESIRPAKSECLLFVISHGSNNWHVIFANPSYVTHAHRLFNHTTLNHTFFHPSLP